MLWWLSPGEGWDAFGVNYKKCEITGNQGTVVVSSIWAEGCMLDDCVCVF